MLYIPIVTALYSTTVRSHTFQYSPKYTSLFCTLEFGSENVPVLSVCTLSNECVTIYTFSDKLGFLKTKCQKERRQSKVDVSHHHHHSSRSERRPRNPTHSSRRPQNPSESVSFIYFDFWMFSRTRFIAPFLFNDQFLNQISPIFQYSTEHLLNIFFSTISFEITNIANKPTFKVVISSQSVTWPASSSGPSMSASNVNAPFSKSVSRSHQWSTNSAR